MATSRGVVDIAILRWTCVLEPALAGVWRVWFGIDTEGRYRVDIEEQLALAAETDQMAAHMEVALPAARQRFLDMLPQFMEIRETGTQRQVGEVDQLVPRVLTMLDYIDSCMEHTSMVRADMALIRSRLAKPDEDDLPGS